MALALHLGSAEPARADAVEAPPRPGVCDTYAKPTRSGEVPDALDEMSGLAASRIHDGIYWSHNDSGNAFELFAIDASGKIHARFPLRGGQARDIEDIAVGPCRKSAPESCVYLGDFGDNRYRRPEAQIYRLPEPLLLDGRTLDVERLRFRWPDRPQNAEAMVVDSKTGTIFIWTKEPLSLGVVHRLENLSPTGTGRAVAVKQIHSPDPTTGLPTGADTHPGGERIVIRTYNQVWELRKSGADRVEDILEAEPVAVPGRTQRQSEAISYTHDGRGFLLGSEGRGSPIYAVGCAPDAVDGSSRSSS